MCFCILWTFHLFVAIFLSIVEITKIDCSVNPAKLMLWIASISYSPSIWNFYLNPGSVVANGGVYVNSARGEEVSKLNAVL